MTREEELKRSRSWRVVMTVSSVLIVLIAIFFLVRMFRSNPLEGTWNSEETEMVLVVDGNSSLTVRMPGALEDGDAVLRLPYTIDKEEKTINIQSDAAAIRKAARASDGAVTEEMLKSVFGSMMTTFDYSVDHDELTLTEREYGEQMTFARE